MSNEQEVYLTIYYRGTSNTPMCMNRYRVSRELLFANRKWFAESEIRDENYVGPYQDNPTGTLCCIIKEFLEEEMESLERLERELAIENQNIQRHEERIKEAQSRIAEKEEFLKASRQRRDFYQEALSSQQIKPTNPPEAG